MHSSLQFILVVLSICISLILIHVGKPKNLYKTEQGKGIAKGIVIFAGAAILFGLYSYNAHSDTPRWLSYAEVYVGMDYTKKISPQCEPYGDSDRATSNGGLVLNVYESGDKLFNVNSKYTHHSCAFSVDRESYDALGIEATYRFWTR